MSRLYTFIQNFLQAWADYPLPEGSVLAGRYTVISPLGVGSYGITYRCYDRLEQRTVALKQAKPSKKGIGQRLLARERDVLQALDHPYIPACRGYFEEKRSCWLVTDLVEGQTLEDLIFGERMTFGEQDTVRWTLTLLERVRHVHDRGYAHMDIRIPNVIMHAGELYLIDFGLAARLGSPLPADHPHGKAGRNGVTPPRPASIPSDLSDIGDLMLFMLYSRFDPGHDAAEADWMDELALSLPLKQILLRLLEEDKPYLHTSELVSDLERSLPELKA
ncbi:serine/threonine protein kinase [Paenibacillus tepidiphilus]|uniref:serine/threonine protein kinase n=1 Tax=Paenibacillus tepidiphilus TaxID=2608683 RepID=UPI00123B2DC3|nr:protein kinase [Paenibacillus tepidiphilus]